MTQDEIIEMAKLAGWEMDDSCVLEPEVIWYISQGQLEAFAKLVDAKATAKEREACAQILANTDLSGLRDHPLQNWVAGMLFEFIKAIRARGEA
jgi:hypothetical protein